MRRTGGKRKREALLADNNMEFSSDSKAKSRYGQRARARARRTWRLDLPRRERRKVDLGAKGARD
eukprot:4966912-Pleurochrysis_carterae.AAC.1